MKIGSFLKSSYKRVKIELGLLPPYPGFIYFLPLNLGCKRHQFRVYHHSWCRFFLGPGYSSHGLWRLQVWFSERIDRAKRFLRDHAPETPNSKRERRATERVADFRAFVESREAYEHMQQEIAGAIPSPYPARERLSQALRLEVARLNGYFRPGNNHDADRIINRALRGEYGEHPSLGLLISAQDLYQDCISAGLTDFAKRVQRGEFDATASEKEVSHRHIQKTMREEEVNRRYKEAHRWDIPKDEWWKPKL